MNRLAMPQVGPTIKFLLIANIGVYLLQILPGIGHFLLEWGSLVPAAAFSGGQVWRLLTYMFLHDPISPFHLLFNMLALWMFGMEIEVLWGSRRFAWFYFISGVGSGCFSVLHLFSPAMRVTGVIGASGAVLALLTVYAIYYPHRQVLLFFILPVNIRVVVIGFASGTVLMHPDKPGSSNEESGLLMPRRSTVQVLSPLGRDPWLTRGFVVR